VSATERTRRARSITSQTSVRSLFLGLDIRGPRLLVATLIAQRGPGLNPGNVSFEHGMRRDRAMYRNPRRPGSRPPGPQPCRRRGSDRLLSPIQDGKSVMATTGMLASSTRGLIKFRLVTITGRTLQPPGPPKTPKCRRTSATLSRIHSVRRRCLKAALLSPTTSSLPSRREGRGSCSAGPVSSRFWRNVASDATPRPCKLVAAVCRHQCGSKSMPVRRRSRRTRS
jgi:hypothetical protein